MDRLEEMLSYQHHIENPEGILEILILCTQIAKFWRILSEEQKEYIQAVRLAVEEQNEWNVS